MLSLTSENGFEFQVRCLCKCVMVHMARYLPTSICVSKLEQTCMQPTFHNSPNCALHIVITHVDKILER